MVSPFTGHGREHNLDFRELRHLRGWNRAFGVLLLIAIPVGAFHIASGRIGNGLIAFGAVLIGSAVLMADVRGVGRSWMQFRQPAQTEITDEADEELPDDWLDRPTDAPLPAPFQAFIDELMQNRVQPDEGEQHAHEQS